MQRFRFANIPLIGLAAAALARLTAAGESLPERVEFNRDIRPILSNNCFKCHGFDPGHREGKRRLDTPEGACANHDGVKAIVPGHLEQSEVHLRTHSSDKDEMMPPPKSGKKLSDRDREVLDRWIAQGAAYQPHWAFAAPVRPEVPKLDDPAFIKNSIDDFVLRRQRELHLTHAPEADRTTQLRRLSFDLTGLPPSPKDVQDFLADSSPDAYGKQVDRLLTSPAFGERMTVYWLDLVRYADSAGFHADSPKEIWAYRDYVIQSFNENKPFDQFTIEQLAGDLLADPTVQQKIASGFNRLNLTTNEVGAQARDYTARTLSDRVRAVGTVWLGLTTGCAQCHDHKFDPITTKDFYRLGAFFADIREEATGEPPPGMPIPNPDLAEKFRQFEARIAATHVNPASKPAEVEAAELAWEQAAHELDGSAIPWKTVASNLRAALTGSRDLPAESETGWPTRRMENGLEVYSVRIQAKVDHVTGFRVDALAARADSVSPGEFVLAGCNVSLEPAKGDPSPAQTIRSTATERDPALPLVLETDLESAPGTAVSKSRSFYFDLENPVSTESNETLVFTLVARSRRSLSLDGFRVSTVTAPGLARAPLTAPLPRKIAGILSEPLAKRTAKECDQVDFYFRQITPRLASDWVPVMTERRIRSMKAPRCLVSEFQPEPRIVRILPRGNWQDESGEVVEAGTPAFLTTQPTDEGRRLTRLDLAKWLVARDNPLTARVFVNRLWKLFFGIGLSKTLDDFGAQGEPPTNPELLDWLAAEFVDSGWDVKHVVRLIATSGIYRQSSNCSKELRELDPENRELARQSRFRLDAEFVRDNALAVSGLLIRNVGGPSVKPYQPARYWENLNFPERVWGASGDHDQWRRGLYTWRQRTYPHPSLSAFDAPSREECVAERTRSNIPQQVLALLNDPTYVEAARAFAARALTEGGATTCDRLTWAFQEALSRAPRPGEIQTLTTLLEKQILAFAKDPKSAEALTKSGFLPFPKGLVPSEWAAWTNIVRVILNLNEMITRS